MIDRLVNANRNDAMETSISPDRQWQRLILRLGFRQCEMNFEVGFQTVRTVLLEMQVTINVHLSELLFICVVHSIQLYNDTFDHSVLCTVWNPEGIGHCAVTDKPKSA